MNFLKEKWIASIFFILLLTVGFFTYRSYGLSWDEPISHMNGQVSWEYVVRGNSSLNTYSERLYGVLFEIPLVAIQQIFSIQDPQALFFMRHLATFLFFVVGVFFFFLLCKKILRSWKWALLASAVLVLSPRIFADAFYNSKDIPVLVAFIISAFSLARFVERPTKGRLLFHAFTTAVIIAIRIPGVFMVAITFMVLVFDFVTKRFQEISFKRFLSFSALFTIAVAIFTTLLWPYLWKTPGAHFVEAFQDMSHFSRQIDMTVLYFGNFIKASELPWHYIPVWILVTTPLFYLGTAIVGITVIVRKYIQAFANSYKKSPMDLVFLAWLSGPLIAVIVFQSVLYDGWRHLYFVYPALVYFVVVGIKKLFDFSYVRFSKYKKIAFYSTRGVLAAFLVSILITMVSLHPYQQVYFNALGGGIDRVREKFDLDYWGLSFREGLEYIARTDQRDHITVAVVGGTLDNVFILETETAGRLSLVPPADIQGADYVVSNYRWQQYATLPHSHSVYEVVVRGGPILSVFKIR